SAWAWPSPGLSPIPRAVGASGSASRGTSTSQPFLKPAAPQTPRATRWRQRSMSVLVSDPRAAHPGATMTEQALPADYMDGKTAVLRRVALTVSDVGIHLFADTGRLEPENQIDSWPTQGLEVEHVADELVHLRHRERPQALVS